MQDLVQSKGRKSLAAYRCAEASLQLPQALHREAVLGNDKCAGRGFELDGNGYKKERLSSLVQKLSKLVKNEVLGLDDKETLEQYWLTPERMDCCAPKNIHDHLKTCAVFCSTYQQLIAEIVGPHLLFHVNAALSASGDTMRENEVLYQFPPTLRIFCSTPSKTSSTTFRTLGKPHCDSQYGKPFSSPHLTQAVQS